MSSCYEIRCIKPKDSNEWKLHPEPIKLITSYNRGWSDTLVNHIKTDGYYFLIGSIYSYNDEIRISSKNNSTYPPVEIMSFIINLDHKNENDRFNKLVFDYLVKFSASSIRNLKLKEIGV